MSFSEREGFVKKLIQKETLDIESRNRLWNVFVKFLYKLKPFDKGNVLRIIWTNEMKKTIDDFPEEPEKPEGERWEDATGYFIGESFYNREVAEFEDITLPAYEKEIATMQRKIKKYFLNCEWYRVYDFIEFLISKISYDSFRSSNIKKNFNKILEEEKSAYRIVENIISNVTDEIEIEEIEKALHNPIGLAKEHIKQALLLYSDRQNPDYRNSIKESISAVESLCKVISKNPNATLGDALKIIENNKDFELHQAQREAFSKLYGWTSDKKSGIRHGMLELTNLKSEDARFMLIVCSAFVNYLIEKSINSGLELS